VAHLGSNESWHHIKYLQFRQTMHTFQTVGKTFGHGRRKTMQVEAECDSAVCALALRRHWCWEHYLVTLSFS
jgi:hypothetical protein